MSSKIIIRKKIDSLAATWAPHIMEFCGTYMFVCTVGTAAKNSSDAAFAIGSALMVLVYIGGHVSGGHFNPAVTLSILLSGRDLISQKDALLYMAAQFLGGLLGGMSAAGLVDDGIVLGPGVRVGTTENFSDGQAFTAEFLYTALLAFTVLNVATVKSTAGNSFFGLAIGFAVVVGASAVGRISGGAFNPAIAFGITLSNSMFGNNDTTAEHLWIYLIADFMGGAFASFVFYVTNPQEFDAPPAEENDVELPELEEDKSSADQDSGSGMTTI